MSCVLSSTSQRALDRLFRNGAGGPKRLPPLLFGQGIVLVVDLQGFLAYNIKQQGMFHGFPQRTLIKDVKERKQLGAELS
jgi:hypothetical protein